MKKLYTVLLLGLIFAILFSVSYAYHKYYVSEDFYSTFIVPCTAEDCTTEMVQVTLKQSNLKCPHDDGACIYDYCTAHTDDCIFELISE